MVIVFNFSIRISAGMGTVGTTVGTKTKSIFQSLKDKTEQLKNKRTDYVEPADVAENKVGMKSYVPITTQITVPFKMNRFAEGFLLNHKEEIFSHLCAKEFVMFCVSQYMCKSCPLI